MSALPRIAVVTPSLNQSEFLERAMASVLGQEYPCLEYVVVDGGSSDGSGDIVAAHADRLAWWVSEPDNGLYHAVNKGFARTTGDIMCWINSSDTHYPWTLATVAEVFSQLPEVEWILGVSSEFGLTDGPKKVVPAFFNTYDVLAGRYRWIQQESVFWRRSLWERAGGRLDESLPRVADFDLWLRFLRLAPLYHVETVLGGFRHHDDALGDQSGGPYQQEAAALLPAFAASFDERVRRRGRLVRAVARDRRRLIGQALHRFGVWPWYEHPRVLYDFDAGRWFVA
jgi:glycosyltransferase involved in cell wall biosynthesis